MSQSKALQALVLGASLLAGTAEAQALYAVKDLSPLTPELEYMHWVGLNNDRDMFGVYTDIGGAVYSQGVVRPLGFTPTGILRINNRGDVITNKPNGPLALGPGVLINRDGFTTEIPPLYPRAPSGAVTPLGLNDAGVVVGHAPHERGDCLQSDPNCMNWQPWSRAFVYAGGTTVDLGTLGGNRAAAVAVNAAGTIVGWSTKAGGDTAVPFIYENGRMSELAVPGIDSPYATHIGDAGQVVGYGIVDGWNRSWLVDNGKVTFITVPEARFDHPVDINRHGQVIGNSGAGAWTYANGKVTMLTQAVSEPGWEIRRVSDLNDRGLIVAEAVRPDGKTVPALLVPLSKQ